MALAKNFTGPTMARLSDAPSAVTLDLPGMLLATVLPIWWQPRRRLTMIAATLPTSFVQPDVQIPPPPLGRLIFSTFPAAYKEKKTVDATGQLYPPRAK